MNLEFGIRDSKSLLRAASGVLMGFIFLLLNGAPLVRGQSSPSVILVTIDTLRADRLGCYGYAAGETPTLDALARAGTRFKSAYTPVPITLPAHASLLTGMFPMATGMHDFSGNKLPASIPTVARLLKEKGYTTAAFIGSAVLDSRFGLNEGFETYFDHFDFSRLLETNLDQMERRGDLVVDEALSWLKRGQRRPIFLWVHIYDPHHPYTPPEPFASKFRARPYDGEVAFADAQVGRLLAALKQQAILDSSLVVVAGDHGEGLGEHGEATHGFFIYNSTLHVPLIIKVPGVAPRVVEDEVSLVDVMPTILQALKIPIPSSVQGRSLLGLAQGRPGAAASNLYAETYLPLLHFRWNQLRSLQVRGIKYIEAPKPEIYDLKTDPGELKNLYATRKASGNEMRDRLNALIRRLTPSGGATGEKEFTDPALFERLKSLGYVAVSAGSFAEAGGEPLPDPKDRIEIYELVSAALADSQRGRYADSLAKLRQAEKVETRSVTIHYLTALNYYRQRDFPRAIERFEQTLRIDPKFALAAYYLGQAYLQTKNLDAATAALERALELDPTNFTAAYNLGAAYLQKQRVEAAQKQFERAVEINPNYAPGYGALGELYLYLNRPADAARVLERAVELAPRAAKAHANLARAYQALGRAQDAARELEKAKAVTSDK
jgi:arylsulfatase A-like enzyme/Flp pilus assembly protein TadD